MKRFTPGPWIPVSSPEDLNIYIYPATDLRGPYVAEIPVLIHHHEDARLIAQAPEMYECLKYLFKNVRLDVSEFWEVRIAETLNKVDPSMLDVVEASTR
jgi:hypothetical protein